MKKWRCTVCGYIHEGEAPPEECPVCKAPAEMFEEVVEEEAVTDRRRKCTVCGYIQEGDEPLKSCPICKAAAEKFIEIDRDGNQIAAAGEKEEKAPEPEQRKKPGLLVRLLMLLHVHPISAHLPNGILPVAVIFLAIAVFLGVEFFEKAAYYNLAAVLIAMPLVLLTGYVEWKNRYQAAKTFLFITKISCAVIVTVTLAILVAWRIIEPGVAGPDSPFRLIYFGIAAVMLAATAIAGHLGGKLVFGSRELVNKL